MDKSENTDGVADDNAKNEVTVKAEPDDDSIKNYAEHTMNELLGLFGYEDKVNSTDTESLNLDNYTESKEHSSKNDSQQTAKSDEKLRSKSGSRLISSTDEPLSRHHMKLVTVLRKKDEEEESGCNSRDPAAECTWCHKVGSKQVSLETPIGTKVFCSEVCFTQCRRASFKKSKTCDWCKHIRHTVNYVEFQDGETQLQFCSEKCLNQYKMSIFCKETQEHLQKMSKKDPGSVDEKENEHQILITPELWMRGEHARRAAEARESARERERNETNEKRESYRKSVFQSSEKDITRGGNHKIDTVDKSKQSFLEKIKQEANLKHRRSLLTERNLDRSSPTRSESQGSPPSTTHEISIPNHFLHPSLAAMAAPWIHQAQLMGAFTPGFLPYGPIPPVMLTGYVPPPPGNLHKECKEKDEQDKRPMTENSLKYNLNGLLSPGSENSARSGVSPRSEPRISPAITDRRTSSLFPVDFPQQISGQNGSTSLLEAAAQRPAIPGVPPVTMMFPFPVPLPLPVPIPIPIPLTMKQLTTFFGEKEKDRTNPDRPNNNPSSSPSKLSIEIPKEARSPAVPYSHSPQSVTSIGSDFNCYEKSEVRSGSCNSCPDLSTNIKVAEFSRIKRSESQSYKRSRTPETLDLSKNSKIARYMYHSATDDSNDGVIDLSSTRCNGVKHENEDTTNGVSNEDSCLSRDDNDNYTEDGPPVPKIHIITHTDDAPLNQPLPLPPTDNSYSSRRGLILDAPAILKKSRSPSPERRVYVRNVPRDIIEAARRRCMRARIRTK